MNPDAPIQHPDATEETFAPSNGNTVRMYTCGLTVYARGHIGNFRTFVCIDVLRRTLKYLQGHEMRQVLNFTDIDDRTIAGAQKAGMDLREYTEQYIAAFRRGCPRARPRGGRGESRARPTKRIFARWRISSRRSPGTATPTSATGRSISRSRRCPATAGWRGSITKA